MSAPSASDATWVAEVLQDGQPFAIIFQAADGAFLLRHPDLKTEPLTELEVRRFVVRAVERAQLEEVCERVFGVVAGLGIETSPELKAQIVERVHRQAYEAGLTRTGSAPDLSRFLRHR
jgi:hypothetical protein